jgi:hypothetical protein
MLLRSGERRYALRQAPLDSVSCVFGAPPGLIHHSPGRSA